MGAVSEPAQAVRERGSNRLLAMLSPEDYGRIAADLVVSSLPLYRELYQGGIPIDALYFPLDCVVSILVGDGSDEPGVEVATIGNEGAVGVYSALGAPRAIGTEIVQV